MQSFLIRDEQVKANCIQAVRALPAWKVTEVVIQTPKKSSAQRRYWHMLIGVLAKETGEDPEDLKMKLKYAWLPLHEIVSKGTKYLVPPSTESLTKEQYGLLIDKTLLIFEAMNMVAPAPGYYGIEDFKAEKAKGTAS